MRRFIGSSSAPRSYEILDEPTAFDQVTRLAASSLEVPVATISLLEDEQHAASPTSSLCAQTIAGRAMFVVEDVAADARFREVSAEPPIRFYAGVPLIGRDGELLGTFYVVDVQPRELAPRHRDILRLLADQIISLLEFRRIGNELRTEQHRLGEREQELTSLLDSMSEGVVKQDRSGAIVLCNRAAESILGIPGDVLGGRTSADPEWRAIHPDGSPFPGDEHPAMLALSRNLSSHDVEMGLIHPVTGARKWIAINSRPLTKADDDRPYAALTTFRDVTEQRGVQERLAQHERLVATGTLAAGVGHEINNPLAFMMANLALAIEEVETLGNAPPDRVLEITKLLEQAQKGGERVKRIIRGLRSLARPSDDSAVLDPHEPINSAIELTNHELRGRVTVSLELAPVSRIVGDEGRLTQVIVNLVVNAAQSFETPDPANNRITIRTYERDRVIIEVSDNGPGIAPEVVPRIFDPFFTTKAPGGGTGLGLSISHGIVTAMGGELACTTELGRGSTFRASFPSAREAPSTAARSATGRALVIDDERTILNSLGRILRRDVESVDLVDDPRQALAMFERGERFDLVLCDIWMPHLTGMELFAAVRDLDPAQAERFVFLSGDMTRPEIHQFLAHIDNERFEKPFSIETIRSVARRFVRL